MKLQAVGDLTLKVWSAAGRNSLRLSLRELHHEAIGSHVSNNLINSNGASWYFAPLCQHLLTFCLPCFDLAIRCFLWASDSGQGLFEALALESRVVES